MDARVWTLLRWSLLRYFFGIYLFGIYQTHFEVESIINRSIEQSGPAQNLLASSRKQKQKSPKSLLEHLLMNTEHRLNPNDKTVYTFRQPHFCSCLFLFPRHDFFFSNWVVQMIDYIHRGSSFEMAFLACHVLYITKTWNLRVSVDFL